MCTSKIWSCLRNDPCIKQGEEESKTSQRSLASIILLLWWSGECIGTMTRMCWLAYICYFSVICVYYLSWMLFGQQCLKKKLNFCHYLFWCCDVQTCTMYFLLWNTKYILEKSAFHIAFQTTHLIFIKKCIHSKKKIIFQSCKGLFEYILQENTMSVFQL